MSDDQYAAIMVRLDGLEKQIQDVKKIAEDAQREGEDAGRDADDVRWDLDDLRKEMKGPQTIEDRLIELTDRVRYVERDIQRIDATGRVRSASA